MCRIYGNVHLSSNCCCQSKQYKLWLEDPTQIKYSSGLQRGKNDKIDAKRIALYAFRYIDRIKVYMRPSANIESLKLLSTELNMLCTDRKRNINRN